MPSRVTWYWYFRLTDGLKHQHAGAEPVEQRLPWLTHDEVLGCHGLALQTQGVVQIQATPSFSTG